MTNEWHWRRRARAVRRRPKRVLFSLRHGIVQRYALCLSMLLTLHVVLQLSGENVTRFVPRTLRELRRSSNDWEGMKAKLMLEERFTVGAGEPEVRFISLKRARERHNLTSASLRQAGIGYRVFDAVDGIAPISEYSVSKYAGHKKTKRLELTRNWSEQHIMRTHARLQYTEEVDGKTRRALHERLRFGCYLSHVFLWETLVEEDLYFLVILEDDVVLTTNFRYRLFRTLNLLPKSWDVLYLNGCFKRFGPTFREGLHLARGGLCTYGYVISRKGAETLLLEGALHSEKPIDHMLDEEVLSGNIVAFHADPPLVFLKANITSTLAYLHKTF